MTHPARPVFPDASSPRPAEQLRPGGRLAATLAACLALAAIAGGGIAAADEAEDGTAVTSEGSRKMQDEQSATKASRRKGVKSSASASGMMSGSAASRGAGTGFGGRRGQGQGPSSQNGQFGGGGSGANSNAALQGQMKMKVSISTDDDDEEEPTPDSLDPYVPGGPGGDDVDDATVTRRIDRGRRITTIERAGETITITDSPGRIIVHRLDLTIDPPASRYVSATSPRALAAKDRAAYDLFDRYVVKTPAGRPAAAPAQPARAGMPAFPGMPELPRTGNPEMDRMLDGFLNDQQ